MLWCTACKTEHAEDDFYRCTKSPRGFRAECKVAIRARQKIASAHRAKEPKKRADVRTLADFDAALDAGRCLWRVYRPNAWQRPATWRSTKSRWQTCDKHRNHPDRPIGSRHEAHADDL